MGVIRTLFAITGYGSLASAGTFAWWTRRSKFIPMSTTDYLFNTTFYARNNPENNPTTHDTCVRRVPLAKIKAEYLEKDGRLTERFCAGVWSGLGYAYQRRYLEKKYRGPETASQLWDRSQLEASDYAVGTQITDHFEVVAKTDESIIVRCGDTPRTTGVRASDGLFEMKAEIKPAEGVAEFSLKSVFFQGLGKAEGPGGPMPWHVETLHRWYTKLWMEVAVNRCTK